MRLPIALGLLALSVSCGKKSDNDAASAETTAETVIAALNQAYPGALSISVFPQDNVKSGLRLADSDASPETLKAKAAEADKLLKGDAENCLPPVFLRMPKSVNETCYEFDQEMLVSSKTVPSPQGNVTLNLGTATGKSNVTDSTEACLVSFARSKIKEVENILDQGLGMQQGMICQAVKDKVDVSGADTEAGVELKDTLKEALESGPVNAKKPTFTVKEAKMSKDDEGVYRVKIVLSMVRDGKTTEQTYELNHVPDNTENTSYHGVITIIREDAGGAPPPPALTAGSSKRYLSLAYTRKTDAGANRLQAELRTGNFDSTIQANALNTDGTVNFNAASESQGNEVISGIMQVAFDLNTDDDTGTFDYWQNPGGNFNESARGMIFKLSKNATTGRLEGCGMSGAAKGLSIRKAIKAGSSLVPDSSYHPFYYVKENNVARPNSSCTSTACSATEGGQTFIWTLPVFSLPANQTAREEWAKSQTSGYVTRQCVGQSATGVYEIDSNIIKDTAGYELLLKSTLDPNLNISKPPKPKDPPPPRA